MKRYCLALVLSACGSALWSQETPEQTYVPRPARPLFSTSAAVAEPGVLELELGVQKIVYRDGCEDRNLPAQFNLGINRWFDLRLGWSGPAFRKDDEGRVRSGGGDPVIGGQVQLLRQAEAGLDLGLAHWHKLPRASVLKHIGTGKHDDTLLVTASEGWGRWALDMNVGANWIGRCEAPGRVRQGAASLAVTYAAAPGWSVTLDCYALAGTELGNRTISSVLAVTRELSPELAVDLGVEVGHSTGAPRYALNAGLVWRVGRLWNRK